MTSVAEKDTATCEANTCDAPVAATPTEKVCPLIVTERAIAEVKKIVSEQDGTEKHYLRVRITGGGCSGFKPKLDLDLTVNDKLDEVYSVDGIDVVVDRKSAIYLTGATVDFHNDLNKRGFSVDIAQAKSTCGCGSSFSM